MGITTSQIKGAELDVKDANMIYDNTMKSLNWALSKPIKIEMSNGKVLTAKVYDWINGGNDYLSKLDSSITPDVKVVSLQSNETIPDLIALYKTDEQHKQAQEEELQRLQATKSYIPAVIFDGRTDPSLRVKLDSAIDCMKHMSNIENTRNMPIGRKVIAWTYHNGYCDGLEVVDREITAHDPKSAAGYTRDVNIKQTVDPTNLPLNMKQNPFAV